MKVFKPVLALTILIMGNVSMSVTQLSEAAGDVVNYSHVIFYDLQYQPDSTKAAFRSSVTALLIGEKGSVFGAYGNLNYDTALYRNRLRGGNQWTFRTQPRRDFYVQYRIFKYKGQINTYDKIAVVGSPYFQYTENMSSFNWSILPDTSTIAGFPCQKATCTFGGRNWIAWFTLKVPTADGPYKFCGLPGLIVKVEDDKSYWRFTLTQITNTPYQYSEEVLRLETVEKSSKSQFLQLLKASYDNGFEMEQQYGITFLDSLDVAKQRYKERAKKENNWIEKY